MSTTRSIASIAVMAVVALAATGCVGITQTATEQQGSLGPIRFTVQACADGSPGCAATSSYGSLWDAIGDQSIQTQMLFAVRLPDGAVPPVSAIAATVPGSPLLLVFSRSTSYEAELQRLEPAPAGERWWGYLSTPFAYTRLGKQALTLTFDASLPRPADGSPLPSPLHWRPVVGGRGVDAGAGLPANRPVTCGDSLYEGFSEQQGQAGSTAICVDSPGKDAARGFLDAPLTDFGLAGADTKAPAGSTVSIPFVARRTGTADAVTSFDLDVAGGPPGGTVSLDRTSVPLGGDAQQTVLARVDVPAGTPAGDYPVTVTATSLGKPARTGTAVLSVTGASSTPPAQNPPPVVPPVAADVTAPVLRSARLDRRRRFLRVDVSEPSRLTARLFRSGRRRALATVTKSVAAGRSPVALGKRLTRARLRPAAYRLVVHAADAAGNKSAARTLRFRIAKR